jgi:hypothetical protein
MNWQKIGESIGGAAAIGLAGKVIEKIIGDDFSQAWAEYLERKRVEQLLERDKVKKSPSKK